MIARRIQALRDGDDSGASLVLALVFIVVVAVVVTALLSFADTSLRVTVALRAQAARAAGADGAAQVAIDALRHGSYNGSTGQCFGGSDSMTVSNFYQPPSGPADSATVVCELDTSTSVSTNAATIPGYALLSVGNNALEDGILVKANGNGGIRAQGSVGSRSTVYINHGQLLVEGDLIAAGTCTGSITTTGARNCNTTSPADPAYPPPPAPSGDGTISACAAKVTFTPGRYSSLTALDAAMKCNKAKVYDFRPGIYYFSYTGVWSIDGGTTVAGSDTPLTDTPPAIPGACPTQVAPAPPNLAAGVTFVFGGGARLNISNNAKVEICGRYSSSTPPMAIYGLRNALGPVPAQSGCITQLGVGACPVIYTDQLSSNIVLYVEGMTYLPVSWIDLDLRKSTDQFFTDGLVARAFSVFAPANTIPPSPLASVPLGMTTPGLTVVLLTVYVCPGSNTCSAATGLLRLRAKVAINDPAGNPQPGRREITVYTWSVQR
jgi:hypothetical protein